MVIISQSLFNTYLFTAPLFIIQWQFDQFQLLADQLATSETNLNEWKWSDIHKLGSKLRASLSEIDFPNAVFAPACISHEVITNKGMDWNNVEIDGTSLPSALSCWASGLPDAVSNGGANGNLQISSGKIIPENSSNGVADINRQR